MEKLTYNFKVKTGKEDKVFGTVSTKQIEEELTKKGFKVDKKKISTDTNLSTLGFHKVKVEYFIFNIISCFIITNIIELS